MGGEQVETEGPETETVGGHEVGREPGIDGELERLVDSLLYEGYALYPYTPAAQKNATPTPFGIVYPPAYAERNPATFDRARLQCLARSAAGAKLRATVLFLRPSGERHEAQRHRVEVPETRLGERVSVPFDRGRVTLRSEQAGEDGVWKVSCCVHNTSTVDPGPERAAALGESLISTHIVVRVSGSFVSPLESEGCESVNTWPVLATAANDAILGAAIVLPDHPRLAPESLGNLFDNTEIEEALLLHVHALSDSERDQISAQDPAVRAMIERAAATTPKQMLALHGRMTLRDPSPVQNRPPEPPPDATDDLPGEQMRIAVDGVEYSRGEQVVLRLGAREDPYDRMLDGRVATIRRIRVDMDDRVHFAVSLDDDPMHQVLGETGRFLTFFAGELERRIAP
ncbi:MAG TPA: hypothetical protein VGL54_01865 [Solirubrobacteraceae bacterium]|jgi:hypothetical protein